MINQVSTSVYIVHYLSLSEWHLQKYGLHEEEHVLHMNEQPSSVLEAFRGEL